MNAEYKNLIVNPTAEKGTSLLVQLLKEGWQIADSHYIGKIAETPAIFYLLGREKKEE